MAKSSPAKTATKEAEETEVSSKDFLSSFLDNNKAEHFAFVQPKHIPISTGSLILDSLVTIRSGGVVRLVGKGAELGKTSESFVIAQNYMDTMPKAKTIYFKAEARLTPEIIARSGLKFVFSPTEWETGTVFVFPVNIFEVFADLLETIIPQMHEAGEHLCVILDSLDGLMLRSDKGKALWAEKADNVKVAGVPALTKILFRRLGLPITHYDVLLLVTGQYSADIKLDPYSPAAPRQAETSGGNAIAHQSDYVFQYLPRYGGDQILENPNEKPDYQKNKSIGVYSTLEIKKSGTDVSGTKVRLAIRKGRVGNAIWIEREIVELMVGWSMWTKSGTWLKLDEKLREEIKEKTGVELPDKVQGMDRAYALIESHPEVVKFLYKKFSALLTKQG